MISLTRNSKLRISYTVSSKYNFMIVSFFLLKVRILMPDELVIDLSFGRRPRYPGVITSFLFLYIQLAS